MSGLFSASRDASPVSAAPAVVLVVMESIFFSVSSTSSCAPATVGGFGSGFSVTGSLFSSLTTFKSVEISSVTSPGKRSCVTS